MLTAVADVYGLPSAEDVFQTRHPHMAPELRWARMAAYRLLSEISQTSMRAIARAVGRCHANVSDGIERADAALASSKIFAALYAEAAERCREGSR